MEARAAAARRRVRLDGRHAHVAPATSARTSACSSTRGRRATGRRPAPVRRASLREMQQIQRRGRRVAPRARRRYDALAPAATASGSASRRRATSRTIVAHSGGLPGFGSHHALAAGVRRRHHRVRQPHVHGWGGPTTRRSTCWRRPAALEPRKPQPSAVLDAAARGGVAAGHAVGRPPRRQRRGGEPVPRPLARPAQGGDREAASRRRGRAARGAASSAWRTRCAGSGRMPCDQGALRVSITLAPTMPPTVQFLDVAAVPPGAEAQRRNLCGP